MSASPEPLALYDVPNHTAKLNLTEDFRESARAFVEQRPAGPCKGH